jgi:hypothetical protein
MDVAVKRLFHIFPDILNGFMEGLRFGYDQYGLAEIQGKKTDKRLRVYDNRAIQRMDAYIFIESDRLRLNFLQF